VSHLGLSGRDGGSIDRLIEHMPIVLVMFVSVCCWMVMRLLLGPGGWKLHCFVGWLFFIGCLMTAGSLGGYWIGDGCFELMVLEAIFVSCCTLFLGSVGWELPVGWVMVGCLVVVDFWL